MTVEQLIKKLKKLDQNSQVLIPNLELFVDGFYYATDVTSVENGFVLIDTDHKKILDQEEEEGD